MLVQKKPLTQKLLVQSGIVSKRPLYQTRNTKYQNWFFYLDETGRAKTIGIVVNSTLLSLMINPLNFLIYAYFWTRTSKKSSYRKNYLKLFKLDTFFTLSFVNFKKFFLYTYYNLNSSNRWIIM